MIHLSKRSDVTCVEGKLDNGQIVYIFLTDGMLIDTGCPHLESDLISFYNEHDFDSVALTHHHEDHTGTAAWIQEHKKVPLLIHRKGIDICKQPAQYPRYRQRAWGIRKEFSPLPMGETIQSRNHTWEVIYTPGHAEDHVALFHQETGRLFSGDIYLSTRTKVILDFESIPIIMNSLKTLLCYDFGPMYCSHAGYFEDGKKVLKQKLDYLENLSGEILNLYRQGYTVNEIDQVLFPKKPLLVSISQGEFDSLHIVTSIIKSQVMC
nr:MBL fold metallo-hydrolase [Neobacillus sp. Marseille-Q6967]